MPRKNRRNHRNSLNASFSGVSTRAQKTKLAKAKQINTNLIMEEPNLDTIISLIPIFDGKKLSDVEYFLTEFENLTKSKNLKEEAKLSILKAKLTGTAREKISQNKALIEEKKYEDFKKKLIELFKIKKSFAQAQADFFNLKQKVGQNLTSYLVEFNSVASLYTEKSNAEVNPNGNAKFLDLVKLTRFMDSIRPDLGMDLRKTFPENFEDACKTALKLEEAYDNIATDQINSLTSEPQLIDKLIKLNVETAEQVKSLAQEVNNIKAKPVENLNTKSRFCTICKRSSHEEVNCWYNKANQTNTHHNQNNPHKFANNRGFHRAHYRNYNQYGRQNYYSPVPDGNGFYTWFPNYQPTPPPPHHPYNMPNDHYYNPQQYFNNYDTQGFNQRQRGRNRGGHYNNHDKKYSDSSEDREKGMNNRDSTRRGKFKRGTHYKADKNDKNKEAEN